MSLTATTESESDSKATFRRRLVRSAGPSEKSLTKLPERKNISSSGRLPVLNVPGLRPNEPEVRRSGAHFSFLKASYAPPCRPISRRCPRCRRPGFGGIAGASCRDREDLVRRVSRSFRRLVYFWSTESGVAGRPPVPEGSPNHTNFSPNEGFISPGSGRSRRRASRR